MFPIVLDVSNRLAVVVGGGPVGRRRADALRAAGALVRLVCLEPRPPEQTDPGLTWLVGPYAPNHLDGASLVIAAGPDDVNAKVVSDARARGIWVNCASDAESGDFQVPAVVRRGGLLLTVSTGGASPTLTGRLRQLLEEEFDEAYGRWVEVLAELRPIVLERYDGPRQREVLERLCRWHWLEQLRCEDPARVRAEMLAEVNRG
jgi:precorrin-2 dehydrogenase/sirohydrochlorin ferrochelatase